MNPEPELAQWWQCMNAVRRRLRRGVVHRDKHERLLARLLWAPLLRLIRPGRVGDARRAAERAVDLD